MRRMDDMTAKRLLVFGASGHGKVAADAAIAAGWVVRGFADDAADKRGRLLLDLPVIATGMAEAAAFCLHDDAFLVIGVGDNRIRQRLFLAAQQAGVRFATVVHPRAAVAPSARLGAGTVVFAGVAVNCDAVIGADVILNTGATVDHDCIIGDHAHLSPGVHLGGTVHVGPGTHLGVGVAVSPNLELGAWSIVGVGAAVVANIPDAVVAYGVPAKVVREN